MFSKSIIDEIFTGEFDIVSYTVILNINRIKWIDLDNDLSFFYNWVRAIPYLIKANIYVRDKMIHIWY